MPKVLIVGAGPSGLTMAAVLARYGVIARLVDRAVVPPADRSRAIVVQARTLELFEDLGIVEEVLRTGLTVEHANLFSPSGGHGVIRIRPEWIESRYGRIVTLPQDETERILGALVAANGVVIEHGVELTSIETDAAEVVAQLRHADGHIERYAADWVIGCDGAHSAVRRAAGIPFPGSTYQNECLLGDVDLRWSLPDGEISICPHHDGVLLAFPLPGSHRFRVIMILPAAGESEDRHLSQDEFFAQLTRMTPGTPPGTPPELLATRWLTRYRLHSRGVPAYRRGRCFVAGDAAHIHSPAGAQGMNTGIQDAYNLGWKLGFVLRGNAPETILDSYDEERHRVGEYLLKNTDRFFALLAGGGKFGRLVRRVVPTIGVQFIGLPLLGRRVAKFVSQTGIRYRHSRLSVEGGGADELGRHAPRAGDRVPDVSLGGERRLFELLHGGQYTLLLFAHADAALQERFAALAASVGGCYQSLARSIVLRTTPGAQVAGLVVDAEGRAHERFGAANGAIYLVRPDGYVAFRAAAHDVDGLWRTLRTQVNAHATAPAAAPSAR
jgi:2-polyprenyl-6-methoxyphenol hydroxylase-like FAD-dependent oxidoreductase